MGKITEPVFHRHSFEQDMPLLVGRVLDPRMKRKQGKPGLKPAMPSKSSSKGLTRKSDFNKRTALTKDFDKPIWGDVSDEDIEEELEEVEPASEEAPRPTGIAAATSQAGGCGDSDKGCSKGPEEGCGEEQGCGW